MFSHYSVRLRVTVLLMVLLAGSGPLLRAHAQQRALPAKTIKLDPTKNLGTWEGWGGSMAW